MIRIGICGTGDSAWHLKHIMKPDSGYEVTGCVDPDFEKALNYSRENKIIAYKSIDTLIPYTDVLYIDGEAQDAAFWCEFSIRNCRHVLLSENHLVPNEVLLRLIKLSREANVRLYIMEKYCSLPVMQVLYTLTNKPYLIDIKCEMPLTDSTLMHLFSMAVSLHQVSPRRIDIKKWVSDSFTSETYSGRIEFDNGSLLNLLLRNTQSKPKLELQVFSAKASVTANLLTGNIKIQYANFPDVTDERNLPNTSTDWISKEVNLFAHSILKLPEALIRLEQQQMAFDFVAQWHKKIRLSQIA